ncbi:MAG TPA: TolC family protein [Gemmatimonadaceae bacterium]|nr:TolC family protein [Gemmatimonadaceae bacterium]
MRIRVSILVVCMLGAVHAPPVRAQAPLTRAQALESAVSRGARLAVARADTAVAGAQLLVARARPNPSLSASYSKSVPNYHVIADIPLDLPMLRQLRVRAARLGLEAANLRYTLARALIALDADTTYTQAVAARERLALSRRNALDSDSLLHMVERRRDAGDASDMDVELARVNAGQQANVAAADSLTLVSALLDLQAVLGVPSDTLEIAAVDSLGTPAPLLVPVMGPAGRAPLGGLTLHEAAASLSLESATFSARLQHRSLWSTPGISLGFEQRDPDQHGLLPTFGLGIGLPLFDRNRGGIAQAEAERARAQAELALAQVESRNQLAHATRLRANAMARVDRDRALVTSADRVAAMSLTAYREGASALANVLEAQRSARDVRAQYINDLSAVWIATAELRVLALTPSISSAQ